MAETINIWLQSEKEVLRLLDCTEMEQPEDTRFVTAALASQNEMFWQYFTELTNVLVAISSKLGDHVPIWHSALQFHNCCQQVLFAHIKHKQPNDHTRFHQVQTSDTDSITVDWECKARLVRSCKWPYYY